MSDVRVLHGDCVELMRGMPDCSVDSIVTDPPYELSFMGRRWDASGIAYSLDLWAEALRVLKPGGHLLAFGGTRTYHRMACAIEDAGFEIRDSIHWVYGSGFPKSLNIGKAIDKAAGAEREVVGTKLGLPGYSLAPNDKQYRNSYGTFGDSEGECAVTAPATDEAKRWEGWGTALKPAHEPIVVARKPLSGTVAGNVLVWGTGGLNIDGCRVPHGDDVKLDAVQRQGVDPSGDTVGWMRAGHVQPTYAPSGRWPANVVFDRTAGEALDQQSGPAGSNSRTPGSRTASGPFGVWGEVGAQTPDTRDSGGASRFFTQADFGPDDWPFVYQAKPSRKERNAGLDGLPEKPPAFGNDSGDGLGRGISNTRQDKPRANHHPTVKPVALMRHLVRLVTPPGGVVLDPFAGSGTTLVAAILEGFNAVGCEMTDEYLPIIDGRVAWAHEQAFLRDELAKAAPQQPTLL
jgi:DNA modification methylase